MKILLNFQCSSDLLEVPEIISDHLKEYQRSFDEWISNFENKHKYWVLDDPCETGERIWTLSFDAEAFVDWLNEYILKEAKAQIIRRNIQPNSEEKLYTHINF